MFSLRGHTSWVNKAVFSPDGKFIVTASADNTAKVWNAINGQLLKDLKGHTGWVNSAVYSPDGEYIITISADNTAKLWNASSGELTRTIEAGTNYKFDGIDFTAKHMLSHAGCEVSILDFETGKKSYNFCAVDNNDYMFFDEEGHYDGTLGAMKSLYYTCDNEIIELQQLKDKLWQPHLAERLNKGELIKGPALSDLDICNQIPEVEVIAGTDNAAFKITPQKGGLGETMLFINDKEIKRYTPAQLKKTETGYELNITRDVLHPLLMPGGKNQVTIKSYTSKNDIFSKAVAIIVR